MLQNFFSLYRPLADHWRVYDNSGEGEYRLIARGETSEKESILDEPAWEQMRKGQTE